MAERWSVRKKDDGFVLYNTRTGSTIVSPVYTEERRATLEAKHKSGTISAEDFKDLERMRLVSKLLFFFGKKSEIARAIGKTTTSQIVYCRRVMSGAVESASMMRELQDLLDKTEEKAESESDFWTGRKRK